MPVGVTRTDDDRLVLGEAAGDLDREAPNVTRGVGVPLGDRVGVGVGERERVGVGVSEEEGEVVAGALPVGSVEGGALREAEADSAGVGVAATEKENCVGKTETLLALDALRVGEAETQGLPTPLALPRKLNPAEALAKAHLEARAELLERGQEEGE